MNIKPLAFCVTFFTAFSSQVIWAKDTTPISPTASVTPSACDPKVVNVINHCTDTETYRLIRSPEDWHKYINGDDYRYPSPTDFTQQMLVIIPYSAPSGQPGARLGISSACVLPNQIQIQCHLLNNGTVDIKQEDYHSHLKNHPKAVGVLLPQSSLPVVVLR
jgi:hypothetical protein